MAKLILPKATTETRTGATPVAGEILYDTDEKRFYGGNGITPGGVPLGTAQASNAYVYGLDYNTSVSTAASACKRVMLNPETDTPDAGALRYTEVSGPFSRLPAHNWKRCVINPATREVNYYLLSTDSTRKADGSAADLTGADGEVMVEIPVTYYRIDRYTDGDSHQHIVWLVSSQQFAGSEAHPFFYTSPGGETLRTQYVGAFLPVNIDGRLHSIKSSNPSLKPTMKNNLQFFLTHYAPSGLSAVNISFNWFLCMMMAIEYGTLDIQSAFSSGFTNSTFDLDEEITAEHVPADTTLEKVLRAVSETPGSTAFAGNYSAYTDGVRKCPDTDWESGGVTYAARDLAYDDNPPFSHRYVSRCTYRGVEDPFGLVGNVEAGCVVARRSAPSPLPEGDDGTVHPAGYWFTNDTNKYGTHSQDSLPPYPTDPFSGCTGAKWVYIRHKWPISETPTMFPGSFDPRTFFPLDATDNNPGDTDKYLCDACWIAPVAQHVESGPIKVGAAFYNAGGTFGPFSIEIGPLDIATCRAAC